MIRRAIALSLALWPSIATAQRAECGPWAGMVARLAIGFREHRHFSGIDHVGNLVELYGAKGRTWTLLVTTPGGPTCIVATGTNFDPSRLPLINTDDGA